MSASTSPQLPQSSKASRRANSCKPCRDSKSRCSGGIPCTTCQKKRRKPRCYYLNSLSHDGESDEPIPAPAAESNRTEPRTDDAQPEVARTSTEVIVEQDHGVVGPHENFYGTFSLARSVEEFKQLFPSDGKFQETIQSVQLVQLFDLESQRVSVVPTTLPVQPRLKKKDLTSHLSPLLRRLYSTYYQVQTLLNEGFATQAWSAFASLIRDSELFGLKEHATLEATSDETFDPEPSRQLWWMLIELDAQLSFLLGRQPCIHSSHGVPKPLIEKASDEGKDGRKDVIDFTEFMIEVLNHVHQHPNNRHSSTENPKAKSTRLQSDLGRLQQLNSKLPRLPRGGLEESTLSALAQHQVDVQLGLMVHYCQMLRSLLPEDEKLGRLRTQRRYATKSYHNELLNSLRTIIDIFDYSHKLDHAMTGSSWPRCFGVFSAASMLGITQLQQNVDVEMDKQRIETALRIFAGFAAHGQATGIAQLAAESLAEILDGINELRQQPTDNTGVFAAPLMLNEVSTSSDGLPTPTVARTARPATYVQTDGQAVKRSDTSNFEGRTQAAKRVKSEEEPTVHESAGEPSTWRSGHHHQHSHTLSLSNTPNAALQEPAPPQPFEQQQAYHHNAVTSFNSQMDFHEAGYVPTLSDNFAQYHGPDHWIHPPMRYTTPLFDAYFQSQQSDENFMFDANSQLLYFDPSKTLPMNQTHALGDTMQSNKHPAFVHMQSTSPTRAQAMTMMNAQDTHSVGSTPVMTRAPRIPPQVQVYGSQTGHAHEHTMTSPGEETGQIETSFSRTSRSDRRRSLADTRQPQMGPWTTETSANVNQQAVRANDRGHGQKRRRTPPRPAVPSPTDDSNFGQQQDNAMAMQNLQSQQARALPASRRQSTAQMDRPTNPTQSEHLAQQQYHGAQQAQNPYNLSTQASPYALTMVNEGLTDFNQQMQYHPNVAVTTGPYTDGQGHHWGWME